MANDSSSPSGRDTNMSANVCATPSIARKYSSHPRNGATARSMRRCAVQGCLGGIFKHVARYCHQLPLNQSPGNTTPIARERLRREGLALASRLGLESSEILSSFVGGLSLVDDGQFFGMLRDFPPCENASSVAAPNPEPKHAYLGHADASRPGSERTHSVSQGAKEGLASADLVLVGPVESGVGLKKQPQRSARPTRKNRLRSR